MSRVALSIVSSGLDLGELQNRRAPTPSVTRARHPPARPRNARQIRSDLAGIGTSAMPSEANASSIAFITAGVLATVPPSPTPFIAERVGQARYRAEIDCDGGQHVGPGIP